MILTYIRKVRNSFGPAGCRSGRSIWQNGLTVSSHMASEKHRVFQDLFFRKGNGAPEEIRTPDPQIRSLVLYPAELRVRAVPVVSGGVAIL